VRLCIVCDGAEWIWKHVQALFPQARQVLDSYHCAQYLHRGAKAHYGTAVQAVEWVEATLTRLSLGKVSSVLGGLRRMQAQSAEAAQAMANCWDYLDAHRGRTHYRQLRRGGYPLGSGGIESSNKFMCHVRLKRSGAWWYESNSNHMLALRCAKYNDTLDQVFVQYQQRLWETSEWPNAPFGNHHDFLYGEKVEQELAEGCRRLIKNAIICWNYLYLSQKIGQEHDADRRQALLVAVQQGSVVSWRHVNLHGEYDFSDEKMQDSVGLHALPALALSAL
jgi:hypothetical protein